ncbi:MAG: hypothetical protein A3K19_24390 [Lentisphaerae bacterium RIFOXYB12_FULL_65_16]|nr:MAG: hypothetical protein A3K18_05475 [Lentisphaerae bacterium RIFOXYA12_64_32]OGV90590.1 MAG: hypothetical protein A3K19_24390 [Lentisphaerae bacterium RIFOXYB12_FULL_65_16]
MNARERLLATLSYEKPSLFHHEIGLLWAWQETTARWRREGWDGRGWYELFPIDRLGRVPVNYGPSPEFAEVTLEENDETRLFQDREGVILREFKKNRSSFMPAFVRYPVADLADYRRFRKERFDTPFEMRIMEGEGAGHIVLSQKDKDTRWRDWVAQSKHRQDPTFCFTARWGGFFGPLRSLMGCENACLAFYDQPRLVEEFMEERADSMIRITGAVLDQTDVDLFGFWEDMAGRNGPLVGPELFRQFALPHYRRVCDYLRGRGVKYIFVDSDGDSRKLIPLWMDAGINGIFPCEVFAGMDVVALRREYGKDLLLFGGFDKHILEHGRAEIVREVDRLAPLVEDGGYLPCLDHSAHADIPWDNMRFYVEYLHRRLEALR